MVVPLEEDPRLVFLRQASRARLECLLAESREKLPMISPAFFALAMDTRFSQTEPKELESLLEQVIGEKS